MSDNHATHFTNALLRHVQRPAQMASLFRIATPAALPARAASLAAFTVALPMPATDMLTTAVAANLAANMAPSLSVPFAAVHDQQATTLPVTSGTGTEPVYGTPAAAPAFAAQRPAPAPVAVRLPPVVAGIQRATETGAAASVSAAQPGSVDLGATEASGRLTPGRAVQGAHAPQSGVQRTSVREQNRPADEPASSETSGETNDASWNRLRAIAQAHNAARQAETAVASPPVNPVRQSVEDVVRSNLQQAQAEWEPTTGPQTPARLDPAERRSVAPVGQQLVQRASLQPAPAPLAAQTGLAQQAASGSQAVFEQVAEQIARAADAWTLSGTGEGHAADAPPEGDVQMLPLQAAWPVEQTTAPSHTSQSGVTLSGATPSGVTPSGPTLSGATPSGATPSGAAQPGSAGSAATDRLAAWPQEELAQSLHAVLGPIATAQPTSSPVDIVTPRRLRPAASPQLAQRAPAAAVPLSDDSDLLHTIREQSTNAQQVLAPFAAPTTPSSPPPSSPPPGGEHTASLPADLWRLIGLDPPAAAALPAAVSSLPASLPPSLPALEGEYDAALHGGEHTAAPPADLWRLIGLEPPAAAGPPPASRAEPSAAKTPSADVTQRAERAAAPQPDRQSPAALPVNTNTPRASSASFMTGAETVRGAEQSAQQAAVAVGAAASLTPNGGERSQPASAGLDVDSLARAVYARLQRRLLTDLERMRIR